MARASLPPKTQKPGILQGAQTIPDGNGRAFVPGVTNMAMTGVTVGSAGIHLPKAAAGSAGGGTNLAGTSTDAAQGGFHAVLEDHADRGKGNRSRENATGTRRQEDPRSKAEDGRVANAMATPIAVPAQTLAGIPMPGLAGGAAEIDPDGLDLGGAGDGVSATGSKPSDDGSGSTIAGKPLPTSGTQGAIASGAGGPDPASILASTAASHGATEEAPDSRGQVLRAHDSLQQGDAGSAAELPPASAAAADGGAPIASGLLAAPFNLGVKGSSSVASEQISTAETIDGVGRVSAARQTGAPGRSIGSARQSMQRESTELQAIPGQARTAAVSRTDAAAGGRSGLSTQGSSEANSGSGSSDSGTDASGRHHGTEAAFSAPADLAGPAANALGTAAVPIQAGQHAMPPMSAVAPRSDPGAAAAAGATAGTASGATAWSSSGDSSTQAGPASPMSQVEVARLLRTSAGSELRVGVRSEDFGAVTIHTLLGREQVSAQISVENGRLSSALSSHLASMQGTIEDRLGQGLGVRASVTMGDASSTGSSGNGGYGQGGASGQSNGSNDQPRPQTLAYTGVPIRSAPDSSASGGVAAAPSSYPAEHSRLDIRI